MVLAILQIAAFLLVCVIIPTAIGIFFAERANKRLNENRQEQKKKEKL